MCMRTYACVPLEVRKEYQITLELKLQVVMNHWTWALRTEPRSSGRAASPQVLDQHSSTIQLFLSQGLTA